MNIDLFPIQGGYLVYLDGALYRTERDIRLAGFLRLTPTASNIIMHPGNHPYANFEYGQPLSDFPPNVSEMSIAVHAGELAKPTSDEDLLA